MFFPYMSFDMRINNKNLLNWTEAKLEKNSKYFLLGVQEIKLWDFKLKGLNRCVWNILKKISWDKMPIIDF